MIDRNRYESLADAMASVDDLEKVKRALIRETVIRETMVDTGESREIVAEAIDAMESMGQEAVLELTEGEPTTLVDALSRYVEELEEEDGRSSDPVELGPYAMKVIKDLNALLVYPWPGPCKAPCAACQP